MILPFSGMEVAEAKQANDEKYTPENIKKRHAKSR